MKTSHAARRIVKARGIAVCLALLGLMGVAFKSGEFLAGKMGYTQSTPTAVLPVPNATLSDLMLAASR